MEENNEKNEEILKFKESSQHQFLFDFPRAESYDTMESIISKFPQLSKINEPLCNLEEFQNPKVFIIRSNNEDDIHKV